MPRKMDHPDEIKTEGDQTAHRAMKSWVILLILAAFGLLLAILFSVS